MALTFPFLIIGTWSVAVTSDPRLEVILVTPGTPNNPIQVDRVVVRRNVGTYRVQYKTDDQGTEWTDYTEAGVVKVFNPTDMIPDTFRPPIQAEMLAIIPLTTDEFNVTVYNIEVEIYGCFHIMETTTTTTGTEFTTSTVVTATSTAGTTTTTVITTTPTATTTQGTYIIIYIYINTELHLYVYGECTLYMCQ